MRNASAIGALLLLLAAVAEAQKPAWDAELAERRLKSVPPVC
jgi:hypothetical protein